MIAVLWLLVGIAFAFGGGEIFLRGILGISAWLRIPQAITAATLAAFATSSPEVSVAVNAAIQEEPRIALGDALGSNIVNVGLILGIVLCIGSLPFERERVLRDYCFAMAAPVLIIGVLWDGYFSRAEALGLLAVFLVWLVLCIRQALHERNGTLSTTTWQDGVRAIVLASIGLLLLVLAGKWIVHGGSLLGDLMGMSPYLIGATVVALGTSAPELATAVISKLRGHDEVGVGTILGSNIFNCLMIVGLTGILRPFPQPLVPTLAAIVFGIATLIALWPASGHRLGRGRGLILLFLYGLSIVAAGFFQSGNSSH